MAQRNVRCNAYDDNGNLLDKNHAKRTECNFIHPDNPRWVTARPSNVHLNDSGTMSRGWDRRAAKPPTASGSGISTNPQASNITEGWGRPGGWGDSDASSAWGKQSDSGWGTQPKTLPKDTPTEPRGWGDAKHRASIDKGKERDVAMRSPSPNREPPSAKQATAFPSNASKSQADLPRLDVELRDAQGRPNSFSPTPSTANRQRPLPPARPFATLLSKIPFSEAAQLTISGEDATSVVSSEKSYKGFKGRLALYSDVVAAIQEAVILEVVTQRAHAECARMSQMQISETYRHPTTKTREILDANKDQYAGKVSHAKIARDRALLSLAKLPELKTKAEVLETQNLEVEKIEGYTNELEEWLNDLEKHQSLLKAKEAEEEARITADPNLRSGPGSSADLRALQSLLEKKKWTWKELKEASSKVEAALNEAEEMVIEKSYTRLDEIFEDRMIVDEALPPVVALDQDSVKFYSRTKIIQEKIEAHGPLIQKEADQVGEALLKVEDVREKIIRLQDEKAKIDAICAMAEAQFEEYESRREAHEAEMQELTEQIRNLSQFKRPSPKPATLSHEKTEELLDLMRPVVVDRVKDDLTKVFETLTLRCQQNQDQVAEDLNKWLRTVLEKTERIRRHKLDQSGSSP